MNKLPQPEKFGKGQKERKDSSPYVLPTSQNPSYWNPSCLSDACTPRKDPESEWLVRNNPKTTPITIKLKTVSHMAEQFSYVSLLCSFLPGCPFPIKSLALSAHEETSSDNAFLSIRQEPTLGPWKWVPFLATVILSVSSLNWLIFIVVL